jgi:serine/threonine protein phosphatase PrpC
MGIDLEFGARTDMGCVRENNEDSYGIAPELNLFVLSDGMGGMDSGEVASRLTVDTILEYCRASEADPSAPLVGHRLDGLSLVSNRLASAVRLANDTVYEASSAKSTGRPMGATVVVVRIVDRAMSVAHAGDSRVYLLRKGKLAQITEDHSFVGEEVRRGRMTEEEAAQSRLQNVLVRAVGTTPDLEVDVSERSLTAGDTILLCSDGLTRGVPDGQIAEVLKKCGNAQNCADQMIELARAAGGADNITAIVVRYGTAHPKSSRTGFLGRLFGSPA